MVGQFGMPIPRRTGWAGGVQPGNRWGGLAQAIAPRGPDMGDLHRRMQMRQSPAQMAHNQRMMAQRQATLNPPYQAVPDTTAPIQQEQIASSLPPTQVPITGGPAPMMSGVDATVPPTGGGDTPMMGAPAPSANYQAMAQALAGRTGQSLGMFNRRLQNPNATAAQNAHNQRMIARRTAKLGGY